MKTIRKRISVIPKIIAKYLMAPVVAIAIEPSKKAIEASVRRICLLEKFSFISWWWKCVASFIFISSPKDFGLCTTILLTTTKIASMRGKPSIIREVENLEPLIKARRAIVNPNTDFAGDPDIIFCGGIAKKRKDSSEPAITMDTVEEKRVSVLIPITKRRKNITVE